MGKARGHQSGVLKGLPLVRSIQVFINQTSVKVNGRDKHSSLLPYGNNYGSKTFYSTRPDKLSMSQVSIDEFELLNRTLKSFV